MLRIVLFASLCLLTSCATSSPAPPAPVEQPRPRAPDPRVCADIPDEPSLPAAASIPQPVTPAERAATALFLSFVASVQDWGREAARRAGIARDEACPDR